MMEAAARRGLDWQAKGELQFEESMGRYLRRGCDASPAIPRSAGIVILALLSLSAHPTRAQQSQAVQSGAAVAAPSEEVLQEVVVTAEKRESTVQATPLSITAITGADLEARGLTDVLAVAEQTPGVSFRSAGPGQTEFEIRGVSSTGGSVGTVGFYVDETPITPPSFGFIGKEVIDPQLYDLDSVEVLRGPQGTLYGAGSMGGTIRVLTNQPVLNKFDSSVEGTTSGTQHGGLNWAGNAMLNIPISTDLAALRLVASSQYTDGWLDRFVVSPFPFASNTGCAPTIFLGCARGDVAAGPIVQTIPRVNVEREDTFRPSLLIKPTDQLGLTVSALYQHTTMGGYNDFDIPPGCPPTPCGHYQPFNLQEPFDDTVKLLSGVLHYNASFATLTSVTSSWTRSEQQTQDASEAIENLFTGPYVAVPITELDRSEQFSQELRLTSSGDSRFQWLAGLFYSNFIYRLNDYGANTAYAEPINPDGVLLDAGVRYDTKQYAAFAEVSYQIAPFWKFTTGLRAFRYDSNLYYFESGVFAPDGPGSQFTSQGETSDHGINPKFNLAYIPNDNLTVYGTASKGFRPGGLFTPPPTSGPASCAPSLAALGFPADKTSYGSDSLWNYEIGEKARLLDGRLSVHSDIYLIRWNGIQQVVPLSCGYLIEANSGQARSYGPELEMEAVVAPGAKLTLSGAYTKAYIDHPASFLGVAPGAPVFNVPEYMASTSFDYSRPISSNLSIFGRVSETLTGPQWDVAYAVQHLPPYALTDLRVGLRSEHWTSTLFVSNATNTTAILTINNTFFTENIPDLTRATVNQPRTVGLKISWRP